MLMRAVRCAATGSIGRGQKDGAQTDVLDAACACQVPVTLGWCERGRIRQRLT